MKPLQSEISETANIFTKVNCGDKNLYIKRKFNIFEEEINQSWGCKKRKLF